MPFSSFLFFQPAPENVAENILENVPPENPNPLSDINLGGDGDDSGPSKRTPLRCSPRTSNVNRPDPTEITPKNLFGTRSPTINFREFLESSLKGRSILSYYRLKNEVNEENRRILSTLLITNEMENCLKIPNCNLDSLSDLIVKEFPTEEKSNWYVPFAMEGKKRTCAGGKLYHFYHNERRTLREAGMLAKRTQNPNQGNTSIILGFNRAVSSRVTGHRHHCHMKAAYNLFFSKQCLAKCLISIFSTQLSLFVRTLFIILCTSLGLTMLLVLSLWVIFADEISIFTFDSFGLGV